MPSITPHPYFKKLEPVRQWLYRLELTLNNLPNLGASASDVLTINAFNVTLPGMTFDPLTVPYINHDVKFAGRGTQGDMTVTFNTAYSAQGDSLEKLEQWMLNIFHPETEEMGLADDYKCDGNVILLKPNLEEWKIWKVQGVWPSNPGDLALDWSGNAAVTRSTTFSVDKVLPKFLVG